MLYIQKMLLKLVILTFLTVNIFGKECLNSTEYAGTKRYTMFGRPCQRWDAQSPHKHSNQFNVFPIDGSPTNASNYCRDPQGRNMLWCYTEDPFKRWERCPIKVCEQATSMTENECNVVVNSFDQCPNDTVSYQCIVRGNKVEFSNLPSVKCDTYICCRESLPHKDASEKMFLSSTFRYSLISLSLLWPSTTTQIVTTNQASAHNIEGRVPNNIPAETVESQTRENTTTTSSGTANATTPSASSVLDNGTQFASSTPLPDIANASEGWMDAGSFESIIFLFIVGVLISQN